MKDNKKYIVGFSLIVAVLLTLVFFNARRGLSYYYTVQEFKQVATTLDQQQTIKVAGKMKSGTLKKVSDDPLRYNFGLSDGQDSVAISYAGILPDTLRPEGELVVEGVWQNNIFLASKLLTKCPSKYEERVQ